MTDDTPFDPKMVDHLLDGEPLPTMPFTPAREENEPFSVKDEATANWVVRKIVEARMYAHRVQEYADRELRRAKREEQFFLHHYGPQLEAWARQQIANRHGKQKRVRLPAGAIGYHTTPPKLGIQDNEALLDWCKAHLPEAVVKTERVLKMLIRDYVEKTGECPDGADVQSGREKFYIR